MSLRPRILAIDSDPDTVRLIDIKLRRAGFEVLTALTGDQGLSLALTRHPEVLLTEVRLAGCDGLSLIAEAKRQLGSSAPIAILMSRSGAESDILAALSSGADDYIVKPFSPRELLVRITVALTRARRNAEPAILGEALAEREA